MVQSAEICGSKMKIFLSILMFFLLFVISCKETDITVPCDEPFCGCPPPEMGIDGVKLPHHWCAGE